MPNLNKKYFDRVPLLVRIKKFLGMNPGGYTTQSGKFIPAGATVRNTKTGEHYIVQEDGSLKTKKGRWYNNPNKESQKLEQRVYNKLITKQRTNPAYNLKWDDSKVIQVKRGTEYVNVPTNALDSLAKYSGMAGTPIKEALGLAAQETNFGNIPWFNYGHSPTGKNKDIHDMKYFYNFGEIPAEYMVRDFRINGTDGYSVDSTIVNMPPLLHAYQYYNSGKYNPGDPNHTKDVKRAGEEVFRDKNIQEWYNNSGKDFYNGTKHRIGGKYKIKKINKNN